MTSTKELIQYRMRRVIWLQNSTIFLSCVGTISCSSLVYMGLVILGRQKYIQHSQ